MTPQLVVIGSINPAKLNAVVEAFGRVFKNQAFEFKGVEAKSRVRAQPLSDKETWRGAMNRKHHAKMLMPGAQYYVGLEGGAEDLHGQLHEFAWIAIEDGSGRIGMGKSATFIAPPIFRKHVLEGMEIGHITDMVFGTTNSKQAGGMIHLLTNGGLHRTELYMQPVVCALMPFARSEMY